MTIHLAVALDGAGWHPAAWRGLPGRDAPFTAEHWVDLVAEAERGLLDFVTFEDSPSLQSDTPDGTDDRTDRLRGRLAASLIAARVAPRTSRIGLIPTIEGTHAEPFHVSTAIATLDYVSGGRAGWQPRVAPRRVDAAHFGRRDFPPLILPPRPGEYPPAVVDAFAELGEVVEVVRRLWDSWQDDAVVRDVSTGRFVDRDRLHYVDFVGTHFSVKGPSITPRPPQGQPVVAALAHATLPYRFAAAHADVVFVTPRDADHAAALVREVHRYAAEQDRAVQVYADLLVLLDRTEKAARDRKHRLDVAAGAPLTSDAAIVAGDAGQLADTLQQWQHAGLAGFRLRPAVLPDDLHAITRELVPELQRRELFRRQYERDTLRGLLGLPRPANRYQRSTA
jgi:alkanesulfonate monooxygenase SsuD/methylene tetrahydromethanopterin reductase-like flavin-dependent oxidoreductase (luciferase family)